MAFVCIAVVAGCGDDTQCDSECCDTNVCVADAPPLESNCNLLTQVGCAAGRKCTWLVDASQPQYVGHIGCAPDGTANLDEACMFGMPGATGYDNCRKGSVCSGYQGGVGVCKQICDQQGGMPACDAQHVCVT